MLEDEGCFQVSPIRDSFRRRPLQIDRILSDWWRDVQEEHIRVCIDDAEIKDESHANA